MAAEGHAVVMGGTAGAPAKPAAPVTASGSPGTQATEKFRVLFPVAFEDGAVHQPGSVIEISVAVAKEYAHALVRVEGEQ